MVDTKLHVVILGQLSESLIARLERDHHTVTCLLSERYESEYLDVADTIDLVVIRSPYRLTREMQETSPRLRWIIRAGSGTDNIDVEHARSRGIRVFTTPMAGPAVAELAVGLLLSVVRCIPPLDAAMHEGRWLKWGALGSELRGKTMGIVGFGIVGQHIAMLAGAFGMTIIVNNGRRKPKEVEGIDGRSFPVLELNDLLRRSDVLVLACTLNGETRGLIDGEAIALLPRGAVVVNVARGEILDTDALVAAIESGALHGAALDTVTGEPDVPANVRNCDRIVLTPHIGAQTIQTHERIGRRVEDIIGGILGTVSGRDERGGG